jgi:predicted MFS family arabinose efflux permease
MNPDEKIDVSAPGWLLTTLQLSNRQIWLQALGRLLCQVGSGLLYFYIPLVFVNQVGLSATSVGLSLGLSSLTGIAGHILGGILADSPRFGRKITLLLSGGLERWSRFCWASPLPCPCW